MIIHNPILTGSLSLNGTNLSTSNLVTTGSNTFVGNQIVSGSLNVSGSVTATGTLTAQTLVVQTITSSVDFVTGSTRFGSVIGNTHVFTGSMSVSGSGTFSGSVTIGGSSTLDSLKAGINSTHQILIGADSSYAEIQAITQGVGFNKNIILQRQGGNVGIGINPSAWASGWTALQVGTVSLHTVSSFSQIANNIYYDGTNYRYINTSGATRIGMNTDGEFFIGTAASGTAGAVATMITRLSINGSTGAATFSNNVTVPSLIINGGTTSSFVFAVDSDSTFAFGATNGRRTGFIHSNSGDKPGIQFGYDATAGTGIIAGSTQTLGVGLDFYTYNGSSWASRMRIANSGGINTYGSYFSMDGSGISAPPAGLGYGFFPHSGVGLGISSVANGISFWVGSSPGQRLRISDSGFTASTTAASDAGSKTFMNTLNTDCGLIPVPSGTTLYCYNRSGGTNYRALISTSTYFTGQHGNKPINLDLKTNIQNYIGLIVSSAGTFYSVNPITEEVTTGKDAIQISEALPEIKLTDTDQDKAVWGVVTNVKNDNYNTDGTVETDNNTEWTDRLGSNVVRVNGLGEGAIWVTNINGNIENGDYICSSIIPGYGRKQNDDLLHNYTVAKSTMDCDFDLNNDGLYVCEEFEFEGQTYKKAFIGCTYHCS